MQVGVFQCVDGDYVVMWFVGWWVWVVVVVDFEVVVCFVCVDVVQEVGCVCIGWQVCDGCWDVCDGLVLLVVFWCVGIEDCDCVVVCVWWWVVLCELW